uniref:Uncharacterized protein n=1 Tax=Setaria digitata TaxID=48799 RepID=A0A915PFR0_9BILA
MGSHTPSAIPHGQNENGHQHNVYTRRGSGDEFDMTSPSFRRSERTLMDTFRERLNLRTYRESLNAFTCDNEILDEDLGHPPVTHDTPPGTYMGSLQSDSSLSISFRSRSRSDATTTPPPCPQSVGTIVLFPNRSEKKSQRHNVRVRTERHSLCLTDLPELKSTSSSMPLSHLFIDAELANSNDQWYGPSSASETRSSVWNLSYQSSPFQLLIDKNDAAEKLMSPLNDFISTVIVSSGRDRGVFHTGTLQTTLGVESEPTSPFSNCAILIKKAMFCRQYL